MLLCRSWVMESETMGGWIYSLMLKYLFKASFFSDSYLQHYLGCILTYWKKNGSSIVKSDIEHPPYSQNGMIITPCEYLSVRLGVESGSSYRSIESSTIQGHP